LPIRRLIPAYRECSFLGVLKEFEGMQAGARCTVVGLLAVLLGSCAWPATGPDRAHVISEMTDTAAADNAKCQSSGATLGSPAYEKCRALLEDKMSIERDVPPTLGYAPTRDGN
jgi:hypothetical protein